MTNDSMTKSINMKKIIIFFVVLFFSLSGFAQVELGIFAGPHASSARYTVKNVKQSTDFKYGFHIGAECKIPFENQLDFVPAISYKMMGYKVVFNRPSFPPDLLAKDNNTRFHQVDVDLLLQYDFSKKPNHFILRAGPSFNFILSGKEDFNLATGEQVSRSMKLSTIKGYGRYEASVTAQFGFETHNGFTIYGRYLHGLISINNEEDGPSIRNRLIGITIGKFFKSGKNVIDTRNKE
jgi:hypothetical protein